MAWIRCSGGGGAIEPIVYKEYMKFDSEGFVTPWTLNADHKIEVVFHEKTYYNLTTIFGNTYNHTRIHLSDYNNKYYSSSGTAEANFGAWTAGEHTFVANNGNGHCELDGVEVIPYTPTTDNAIKYVIGARGRTGFDYCFRGWIKSFKIYSLATGELLHDVRPCKIYNTDCMFDTVTKTIFTNPTAIAVDSI